VRVRILGTLAALAVAALLVVQASARASGSATATASAAVVAGTLGAVTSVDATGDADESRSAPSKTPKGIELAGGGSASVSSSTKGGDGTALATAEALQVSLLDGLVTAADVRRSATADGKGDASFDGVVRELVVGTTTIGDVRSRKTYELPDGAGSVVVNADGAGLTVKLDKAVGDYPAGTEVVVAQVAASATDGAPTPTATARATATPTRTATPTTVAPRPTATPTPTPHKPKPPAWKRRLMSNQFLFPVRGPTTIGGPFGAYRADTGFHEGNDLFASFGTPVVAVADGTVEKVGSLHISGNRLWVYADGGDQFFYAHLSAFAPAAVDHAHVAAGTVLGYVGNTGDAEPTPPHLHFEIHPNGGAAVDPHRFLVVWQRRAGTVAGDTAQRPGALVELRDLIGDG